MTKQKTVTLNLTLQEYQCLFEVFNKWANSYDLNVTSVKPCKPFIDKLRTKLQPKK